jgi:hypothetical protein
MALNIQIRKIYPFPKNENNTVLFDIQGTSNQIVYNEIEIRKNPDTNGIIFKDRIQEFRYQHIIPANTLQNGQQYSILVRVYDVNQVLLGTSSTILFYVFDKATITIPTIVNSKVFNQTVLFQANYSQIQNELLQSYAFYLYDSNKILISQSGEIYNTNLNYEFSELENGELYYIECRTLSVNENESSSGIISFTPSYIAPKFNSFIQLENDAENACIKLTCNVIRILGTADSTVTYENNEIADLTNNHVYFKDGFTTTGDFVIRMWVKNIIPNESFLVMTSRTNITLELKLENNRINLYKYKDGNIILQKILGQTDIVPNDDTVFVDLRQIGNLYNVV